jgi:hypothetical protein
VRDQLTAGLSHPDMGRQLRRLVLDAGLEPLDVASRVTPLSDLEHALKSFHLFEHLDAAVGAGTISSAHAAQWRTSIEAAATTGRFLVAPVSFRITARKPAPRT